MVDAGEFECSEVVYPTIKKALEKAGALDFYKAD